MINKCARKIARTVVRVIPVWFLRLTDHVLEVRLVLDISKVVVLNTKHILKKQRLKVENSSGSRLLCAKIIDRVV